MHAEPLRAVLEGLIPETDGNAPDAAWLKLPVGSLPNRPLLKFELTVADEPRHRLPRQQRAGLQARYIAHLVGHLGATILLSDDPGVVNVDALRVDEYLRDLLTAMFLQEVGPWEQAKLEYGNKEDPLLEYLKSGLFGTVEPPAQHPLDGQTYENWKIAANFDFVTQPYAPLSKDNVSQNPLLALPTLRSMGKLRNVKEEVPELLTKLSRLLNEVTELAKRDGAVGEASKNVLKWYSQFGDLWVVMTNCLVPLNDPFSMTMVERRDIQLNEAGEDEGSSQGWFFMQKDLEQSAIFADAQSNQISVSLLDANVEIGKEYSVTMERGGDLPDNPEDIYKTEELLLVSSAARGREKRIKLKCVLQPTRPIMLIHWIVLGVVLLTFLAVCLSPRLLGQLTTAHLAMLLTPSTFASSLLLIRESSALSAKLTRGMRYLIAALMAGLWAAAIIFYLSGNVTTPQPSSPSNSSTPSQSP
ncbi:hypothetical protein ACFWWM_42535 [Streptomyces sp. NPDC058682]|uniref:hypothetical protein n=1 Tax=Streptomyces sp. NPDC058682 TaxID=3346596 RepID=UPI0036623309